MLINKDTKIFCSFSSNPGNNGCEFFNTKFQENNINAIYKSFHSDDIVKSINAVKTLNITDTNIFIERSINKDIDIGLYDSSMNLINNNYTIKQNLPSRCYPGVPKNMNIYSNFLFYGKIIDNVMDTNELLLRI